MIGYDINGSSERVTVNEMKSKAKPIVAVLILVATLFSGFDMVESIENTAGHTRSGGTVIPVTSAEISFSGEDTLDHAGFAVSIAGDFNGDSINDILIAAPQNNSNGGWAGKVYLVYGSDGAEFYDKNFDLGNSNATFYGENRNDALGYHACSAGDVNGDGIDDILMSSRQYDADRGKTYIFFGRRDGFKRDMNASTCNVSFIGEYPGDSSGVVVSGAGDVNNDGFDDILISAPYSSRTGVTRTGAVFMIFGKRDGWMKNRSLSYADVIFNGLGNQERLNIGLQAGDVNGDGIDDIVMSQYYNTTFLVCGREGSWPEIFDLNHTNVTFKQKSNTWPYLYGIDDVNGDGFDDLALSNMWYGGDNRGKVYFFFGNSSYDNLILNESHADASYIGAGHNYRLGNQVTSAGDLNMDGISDILIGSPTAWYGGMRNSGLTYLLHGKKEGWPKDQNISIADVTFPGTKANHYAGVLSERPGDVDNDGRMDIVIGAYYGDGNHVESGVVHLFNSFNPDGPKRIYSVSLYSDEGCTEEMDQAEIGDRVYVEVVGEDANSTSINQAYVKVASGSSVIEIRLRETAAATGRYQGYFTITNTSSNWQRLIKASVGDRIFVNAKIDPTKYDYVDVVTPVQLRPLEDTVTAVEDQEYRVTYFNFGVNTIYEWNVRIDSGWLKWNQQAKDLYGIPDNSHVGTQSAVSINISDSEGNWDRHDFSVYVHNAPPVILTENVVSTAEDYLYHVDYDCDDESYGDVVWDLDTNASWLSMNGQTGNLTGTPRNRDVGWYNVEITVDDGKGGSASTSFVLTVNDTNDPPVIETTPKSRIDEDTEYRVNFRATDVDGPADFTWGIETDASWLSMDEDTGLLTGTPANDDVGVHNITVTSEDLRGGVGYLTYSLEVLNTNDAPVWTNLPEDAEVEQGELYLFVIEAQDEDIGDELTYGISSTPSTNITIDEETGEIAWYSYLAEPPYKLNVQISAFDGEIRITTDFIITVIPNIPPVVELIYPEDGRTVVMDESFVLEWEGCDTEGCDLTYEIYLSSSFDDVNTLSSNCQLSENCRDSTIAPTELQHGTLYYWTVIPSDGLCKGSCKDGMFSFYVNTPPRISDISIKEATIGESFIFMIPGGDDDEGQENDLTYGLVDGPQGLEVSSGTGRIQWIPSDSQVGLHDVTVEVFDDYEYAQKTFAIDVKEAPSAASKSSALPVIIGISVLIFLLLAGAVIAFILTRKREEPAEEPEVGEEVEEEIEEEELERPLLKDDDFLMDDEEEHDTKMERRYRDVPISSTEAYRNIKRSDHKLSYDELYNGGQEESLQQHMKELEEMQEPPAEDDLQNLSRILEEEKLSDGPKPTVDMDIEALSAEDPYDHQEYVKG
ncbi:MAG: putative Ig domain-containing protein [Thermoplasmatota archaeon]